MTLARIMKCAIHIAIAIDILYCLLYPIPAHIMFWTSITLATVSAAILTTYAVLHLRQLKARTHRAEARAQQLDTEHLVLMSENDDLTATLTRNRIREMRLEEDCAELRAELEGADDAVARLRSVRETLLAECADKAQDVQALENALQESTLRAERAEDELEAEIIISEDVEAILNAEMELLMDKYEEAVESARRSDEEVNQMVYERGIYTSSLAEAATRIVELQSELAKHEQDAYQRNSVCFEMLKWYEVPETGEPEGSEGKKDV